VSLYLVTPLSGRDPQQYLVAGVLIVIGIILFFITTLINKQMGLKGQITDPSHLADAPD
jgi:basic amino acid/polyamine antiporter, APA family